MALWSGIEKLRHLLVEDAEGICARLDAEIQAAVDAYVDPWAQEAEEPVHPTQFVSVLEVTSSAGSVWSPEFTPAADQSSPP